MKPSSHAATAEHGLAESRSLLAKLSIKLWRAMKIRRKLGVGPVSFVYTFERRIDVTPNSFLRRKRALLAHRHWEKRTHCAVCKEHVLPHQSPAPEQADLRGQLAMIVGVGPGFGYALAKRLAQEGMATVLVSRNAERLDLLVSDIVAKGGTAFSYGCDATDERSVKKVFDVVQAQHGVPDLVVYSLQHFVPGQAIDIEVPAFEESWRHNCLGAFLISRTAAKAMVPHRRGTIVLTGSTSSLIGRESHLNLAIGKFGQRALAQVLARELWPQGIHVAHLVIDADIAEHNLSNGGSNEAQADPGHIADMVVTLHRQPNSAWSSEVDIRPAQERFWEHC